MNYSKQRDLFPGGNTSKGFYSFFRYMLTQEDANRIICLKGGPGTGKSSFMQKIANYFLNIGYSVELFHCSSDDTSLDAIVVKDVNIAILDGTSPHMTDPINPGAVDEIVNLGTALNSDILSKNKNELISLNKELGATFKRAYRFLGAAKNVHEDWSYLNSSSLDSNKFNSFINKFRNEILTSSKSGFGGERHLFGSAFTPNGIVTFNKALSSEVDKLYALKGGPGLKKSDVLRYIGSEAQKLGYFVEYLHDPFIPERLENIVIPEISTGIFTTNEITRLSYDCTVYDMKDVCLKEILSSRKNEIENDKVLFDTLINKGLNCINQAKSLHDELESYYIKAMDFSVLDEIFDNTLEKLKKYAK